jgi:threonyl-tRNA synthetase
MPEKFDIEYTGEDNQRHRPAMIHRVVLGSLERFIGILIEHYSGNLPPWLAPVQVVVLPISEKFYEYTSDVYNTLKENGYRTEIDNRIESLSKKIRQAELAKIPYMLIVGEKEEQAQTVTIRRKTGDDIKNIKLQDFMYLLDDVVRNKKINS